MTTTSPEWAIARVPLLDEQTGRFPDEFAPPAVGAALAALDEALAQGGAALDEALAQVEAATGQMLAKVANLSDIPSPDAARTNLGAAAAGHSHAVEEVTGLTDALATKADLVGGVVPTSQIPARSLVNAVPAADEAAMLALTPAQVQPGDVAVRGDGAGTWMLTDADPSTLDSWVLLSPPTSNVLSVNGQCGVVVLSAADVGAATPADLTAAVAGVQLAADDYAIQAAGSATAAAQAAGTAATAATATTAALTAAEHARDDATTAATAAGVARDATEQTVTAGLTWAGDVDLTAVAAGPVMLHATLTGNTTVHLPTPGSGRAFTVTLAVTQDATGGRTLTVPGARAPYGIAPAPSGPGLVDLVHLLWTGAGWVVATGAPGLGVPAGWA